MKIHTVFSALVAFGLAISSAEASWSDHWVCRDGAYARQRMIAGPTPSAIIGDSITEGFWWNKIGACWIVNAGYAGIDAENMASRMRQIVTNATPRYVIIMIGMNDAWLGDGETQIPQERIDAFSAAYQTIIDSSQSHGATVILATITPIEPGKALSEARNQAVVNRLNTVIVYDKAIAQGLKLINLNYAFMNLSTGVGKSDYTLDGVHLTRASYIELYNQFNTALQAEIARTGVGC